MAVDVERHATAGEDALVEVRFELRDYREVQGKFDRIVSVGMFEHVGLANFPAFFETVRKLLTDDGERRALAVAGREDALARFTLTRFLDDLRGLYTGFTRTGTGFTQPAQDVLPGRAERRRLHHRLGPRAHQVTEPGGVDAPDRAPTPPSSAWSVRRGAPLVRAGDVSDR